GLLQAARGGLVDALRLNELDQAELHRIVSVGGRRLALHHHARTRLQQRDRHHLPIGPENLRHSNLLTKDSWTHKSLRETGDRRQETEYVSPSLNLSSAFLPNSKIKLSNPPTGPPGTNASAFCLLSPVFSLLLSLLPKR